MGIKINLFYSTTLTVSGYLFPLITFPYVTRVLGVENFGICSFYDSIIGYFVLFSMLGIVNLGIREIARVKDNKAELAKVFSGLFTLNIITTTISIVALIIIGLNVDKLAEHPYMIYIGVAKVLVNSLLIEWFYKGIEDFKYITIRSVLVRTIYVISVFLLVKNRNDYILYFGLTTCMFAVNAIINLCHLHRFVSFSSLRISFQQYIKPFIILGVYQLLTSMYTTLNVVILGFISGNIEVGYYSTAVKLYTIIISFFTAFSGTLLPRMSSLVKKNDFIQFKKLISKSSAVLYIFCIPVIVITITFAPTIIDIIAGSDFCNSITPMRIVMPLMLVIGLEQILIYQILFPLKQDKAILINSILGAVAGIGLNFLLVPHFHSIGSAIAWFGSELIVLISAVYFVFKKHKVDLNCGILIKILCYTIPVVLIILLFSIYSHQGIIPFIIASCFICLYYLIVDKYVLHILGIDSIIKKIWIK